MEFEFRREYVFLGTTAARERVLMSGEIRKSQGTWQTVDHSEIIDPWCLSLTSAIFTGRKNISRNHVASGATLEHLGEIVTAAPGYNLAEVRELHAIGTEWHLNTVYPGCVHMEVPEGTNVGELLDMGITCPESGYRWGHAWLTRPLPDGIRNRFIDLMNKGRGEKADY